MVQGRKPVQPVPKQAVEFMLASEFHWTLNDVRNMSCIDADLMTTLIQIKNGLIEKRKAKNGLF